VFKAKAKAKDVQKKQDQGQGQGQKLLKANTKDTQKPLPQIPPLRDRTALTLRNLMWCHVSP